MDFGDVIRSMKEDPSRRFAREGWNGKRMWVYLVTGGIVPSEKWAPASGTTGDEDEYGVVKVLPHIDMCSATGERVIGWLASQTDMLADDWYEAGDLPCPKCGSLVTPQLGCTVANSSNVWTELVCPICGAYMGRT